MPRLQDANKGDLFGGSRGKKGPEVPQHNPDELMEELDKLEKDLNELKGVYELWFMGVERLEPRSQRDLIRSSLRRFKELKVNNTQVKFKFQMLQARMVSLETYWGRVARQKEEGTYKRDLDKVKRHEAERLAKEAKEGKKPDPKADPKADPKLDPKAAGKADPKAALPGLPSPPAPPGRQAPDRAASVARPAAASASDLTDSTLKTLYSTYVTAKRRCGQPVDLKYDEMAASLRKQVPKLMETTGAKAIEFKVVIKSGQAVLKAVPKT